jgi:hypothetical protein
VYCYRLCGVLMSDPIRDCPHGHHRGKCDSCELIEAEKTVTDNTYLNALISPDDEGYMELETLEVCLRDLGYLEGETP